MAINSGDFVNVTISGVRVNGVGTSTVSLEVDGGSYSLPANSPSVTYSRVDPPWYPPIYGDVVTDAQGRPWSAVVKTNDDGTIVVGLALFSDPKTIRLPAYVKTNFGPLQLAWRSPVVLTPGS